MIKIFNEIERVKLIEENGFKMPYIHTNMTYSVNMSDLYIYCRYLRSQGLTPKPMHEKIVELHKTKGGNILQDYKDIERAINKTCRNFKRGEGELREISNITISNTTKDFFLQLVNQKVKSEKRPDIKKITPEMVSVLFTLYCWTLIQKQYKQPTENYDKPWNFIPTDGSKRFLSVCSGVTWKKSWQAIKIFYDLGYLNITYDLDIIMKLDLPDGNDIVIDKLYQTGEYIHIWKGTHAWCPKCGRFFKKKAKTSKETCEYCQKEYQKIKKQKQRAKKLEM